MTERKYITEFAINAYNDKFVLLEQDDFDNDALDGFLPHIYMIVARENALFHHRPFIAPIQRYKSLLMEIKNFLTIGSLKISKRSS